MVCLRHCVTVSLHALYKRFFKIFPTTNLDTRHESVCLRTETFQSYKLKVNVSKDQTKSIKCENSKLFSQTPATSCPYRSIHITILYNHLSNNSMFCQQTRIVWWPDTIKSSCQAVITSIVYSYERFLQLQPCTRFESKVTNGFFLLTVISAMSRPKDSQIPRNIDTEKDPSLELNTNSQML